MNEIGLPTQKRGRLQHIHHGRDRRHLVYIMHIGEHWNADLRLHIAEYAQPFVHFHSAKRFIGAAVCLVERRLVYERHIERRAYLLKLTGGIKRELACIQWRTDQL